MPQIAPKKHLAKLMIRLTIYVMTMSIHIFKKSREITMAKTAIIQTRVDPVIKNNAQMILKKLNISMSEAISMYGI